LFSTDWRFLMQTFEGIFHPFGQLLIGLAVVAAISVFGGVALAAGLRLRGLRWSGAGRSGSRRAARPGRTR
jgi:hypothetical protein